MDIERDLRRELIEALTPDFLCFEEVSLRHAIFKNHTVRADVVAVPIDREYWGHALAFEVKVVGAKCDYAYWSAVIKQAHDYVYAEILGDHHVLKGRRISAALVYPAPDYRPYIPRVNAPENIGETLVISGAFHAAAHLRVGRAQKSVLRSKNTLGLYMGPNDFWSEGHGFTGQAKQLLLNTRAIGSRRIDVSSELGGLGSAIPYPEFE